MSNPSISYNASWSYSFDREKQQEPTKGLKTESPYAGERLLGAYQEC